MHHHHRLPVVCCLSFFFSFVGAFQQRSRRKYLTLSFGSISGWTPPPDGETPPNPFENDANRPSKTDLYANEELKDLLDVHLSIQEDIKTTSASGNSGDPVPQGLHDIVLETLASLDSRESRRDDETVLSRVLDIRAIASDVDGTLLSSEHTLHHGTERAIIDAVEASFSPVRSLQYFFPATGKSRAGALASLGPTIGPLLSQVPGVFIQGLYVCDANGNVIFEQKISSAEVSAAQSLANEFCLSLFGYDGDSMFCSTSTSDAHRDKFHSKFGEPLATPVDDLTQYSPGFHKCLFMHDDQTFLAEIVRPKVEELAKEFEAEVTQAVPYMLEWLPRGGSKANGVQKLCDHLGIDMATELLALGDAENDVEMLKQSAIGVSMGNAVLAAKVAADVTLEETNDMGGAGIAIQDYGFGKLLQNKAH